MKIDLQYLPGSPDRHPYYFLIACIKSCLTLQQIEACERMINCVHTMYAKDLAEMALIKKVELLATIYQPE